MTVNDYPEYAEGQTLTAAELNALTAHVRHRDTLVARMIGFGVNAGLSGAFAGTTLTIQPGLALDQGGEPLVLTTPQSFTFPRTPDTIAYPFIEATAGGFSVVAEATDVETAPAPCTETDCAGHATTHTARVALRVVAGRVSGARFDFSREPLLAVEPMRLSLTSQPQGSYVALRDAIVTRLRNGSAPSFVSDALINQLEGTSIAASDLAGVKGYKAGWINLVLFATLDLLRAEALLRIAALRDATPPGVVLGWVHQVSGAWVFDCAYRHAWEPPRGFTEAFLGGTCSDPLGAFRDQVEGLLAGYAPPDPPTTPPSGGGGVGPLDFCKKGKYWIGHKCLLPLDPPVLIPDKWRDWWVNIDPKVPVWNPPPIDYVDLVEDIYEIEKRNVFEDGVLGFGGVLGFDKDAVAVKIADEILVRGGTPDILVTDAAGLKGLDGYMPAGAASPSDRIVVVADETGRVVATGRVAAVHTAKQIGTIVPQAEAALGKADAAVAQVTSLSGSVAVSLDVMDGKLGTFEQSLGGLQGEFLAFRGGEFDLSGYGVRLGSLEQRIERVDNVGERLAVLEGRVGTRQFEGGVRTIDTDIAAGIAEFTRTAVDLMSTTEAQNPNFQRYISAVQRSQADFEVAVAGGTPADLGMATVDLLDTMRTMVKASGVEPELGRKLDVQFREIKGRFG
ncbi:UNVERIFIED_CONTAM: hypothetical protein OHV15_05145 [Microbacterium sp. SLM126]